MRACKYVFCSTTVLSISCTSLRSCCSRLLVSVRAAPTMVRVASFVRAERWSTLGRSCLTDLGRTERPDEDELGVRPTRERTTGAPYVAAGEYIPSMCWWYGKEDG